MLRSLPPTSNTSHRAALRSHYAILIFSNLISASDTNLNPVKFDWNLVDSVLTLKKCIVTLPKMYTVTFGCKKKQKLEDVSAASLPLHAQNFACATEKNVVPKFTNRLSWTLFSLSQIFLYKEKIQGCKQENMYHRKHKYLHILLRETYFSY